MTFGAPIPRTYEKPTEPELKDVFEDLNKAAQSVSDSEVGAAYFARHGVDAASILTVMDDEAANLIADYLEPRIAGKTVIEIGGGIGLLAMHMGSLAKRVFCIEANPIWAAAFAAILLANKPRNVSYLFGAADEFVGSVQGDVAVFCSHSGISSMTSVAAQMAPIVIDVYGEIMDSAPGKFDVFARTLRGMT